MRWLSIVTLLALLLAPPRSVCGAGAQDADAGAPRCEIRGHASIGDVHRPRVGPAPSVTAIEDRDVRVIPLGHGVFQVRTHGGAPRIEGRTESPVPLSIAREQTWGEIATIAIGTNVAALDLAGERFRVSLAIDEGALLHGVMLGCPDLSATPGTDAALDVARTPRGPVWHARIQRMRIRSRSGDEGPALVLELAPETRRRVRLVERERVAGWARIEAIFAHAHVLGWVRDTDLSFPRP